MYHYAKNMSKVLSMKDPWLSDQHPRQYG